MTPSAKDYPALGERVWSGKIANGLRVRVVPKPGFSKNYAFLATDYGSMDTSFISEEQRKQTHI